MIAPDGSTGDIPQERAAEAQAAGFKPAVVMTSPDGKMGYIPRERANDALKAGFKVGQPTTSVEQQGPAAYGFTPGNIAKNVGRGLSELGKGAVQIADDVGGAILPQRFGGDPITQTKLVQHIVDPMQAEAAKARQGGPGSVGHAIASGIPMIGPYAANLGEQAGSGDVGGALARGGTQMAAHRWFLKSRYRRRLATSCKASIRPLPISTKAVNIIASAESRWTRQDWTSE
jgi:hypothetical protein